MKFLIVDEIGSYADVLVKFLKDKGHFVELMTSADENSPLSILHERRSQEVDILIFHTGGMPQASALTFCSFARQLWPNMVIVVDGIGSAYSQVADFIDVRPGPKEVGEIIELANIKSARR